MSAKPERVATRLGQQPAMAKLLLEGWNVRALSREINVSYQHLYKVLTGRCFPNPTVRMLLPVALKAPLDELLTAEAIAGMPKPSGRYKQMMGITGEDIK